MFHLFPACAEDVVVGDPHLPGGDGRGHRADARTQAGNREAADGLLGSVRRCAAKRRLDAARIAR